MIAPGEVAFEASTTKGERLDVVVRERESGLTVHIGRGHSEYRVKDLVRHPLLAGETFCIYAGRSEDGSDSTVLDAPSTERLMQLAREASGVDEQTISRINDHWRTAQQIKTAIYADAGGQRSVAERDGRWSAFHELLDQIDALYAEAAC
jgi:hypothetical protein